MIRALTISLTAFVVSFVVATTAWASAIVHHDVKLDLDPFLGRITVADTITIDAEGETAFRLSSVFVVTSLRVDGQSQPAGRVGEYVVIKLNGARAHAIDIAYTANLSTLGPPSQPPLMTEDGGFFFADWLAQPDGLDATWAITGTTPRGQKWIVPGHVSNESEIHGHYQATFTNMRADEPPMLITGPFDVEQTMVGDVWIRTYFHPELAPFAKGYLDDTARYIKHYAQTVGPYPYPGFAIVSGPMPIGIGLPGMTYMGRRVLALPFIRATSLPHEVLHNWWGNAVRVDYESGNWAEGLTTYLADHAQSASQNQDGGHEARLEWLRNYAALPRERDEAVTAFRSKTHDASQVIGYNKVAYVFHMLKMRLGAATFERAVQRFYADNSFSTAGWVDIQAAFEAASNQDLSTFFDAWLDRTGAPELALSNVDVKDRTLSFTVTQTQDGPAYPLALDAVVHTANADKHLRLDMTDRSHRYTVTLETRPRQLSIDPDLDVFRRLSAEETPPILRDVSLSPDTRLIVAGRDQAVKSLAHELASGLVQSQVRLTSVLPPAGPVIIAGLNDDVASLVQRFNLPAAPASLDDMAPNAQSAQALAYVVRDANGRTVLVAQAQDIDGLQALARALGHYKRRSFVVVNQGRVTDKGVWPAPSGPLTILLAQ